MEVLACVLVFGFGFFQGWDVPCLSGVCLLWNLLHFRSSADLLMLPPPQRSPRSALMLVCSLTLCWSFMPMSQVLVMLQDLSLGVLCPPLRIPVLPKVQNSGPAARLALAIRARSCGSLCTCPDTFLWSFSCPTLDRMALVHCWPGLAPAWSRGFPRTDGSCILSSHSSAMIMGAWCLLRDGSRTLADGLLSLICRRSWSPRMPASSTPTLGSTMSLRLRSSMPWIRSRPCLAIAARPEVRRGQWIRRPVRQGGRHT